MKYWNSYDIFWDTNIEKYYDPIAYQLNKYLEPKLYSLELDELRTIINSSPGFNFTVRRRFSRKEKVIFFDIVIDYKNFMALQNTAQKKECIALSFLRDIDVLSKFKPKGFNLSDLKNDCMVFFKNIGWLPSTPTPEEA